MFFELLPVRVIHTLWTANAIPCNNPQTIYVQFAPCHIPPITIVKIKFIYVLIFPFLFPPSEM